MHSEYHQELSQSKFQTMTSPTQEDLNLAVPAALRELDAGGGPNLNAIAHAALPILERYIQHRWTVEDAEAMAGETLGIALARLHEFDPSKGGLIGWMVGITCNLARTEFRLKEKHESDSETSYAAGRREKTHFKDRPTPEQRTDLLNAILSLPESDHRLISLFLLEHKDAPEVAAELGITAETARKRKERILKKLHAIAETLIG